MNPLCLHAMYDNAISFYLAYPIMIQDASQIPQGSH